MTKRVYPVIPKAVMETAEDGTILLLLDREFILREKKLHLHIFTGQGNPDNRRPHLSYSMRDEGNGPQVDFNLTIEAKKDENGKV